MLLLGWTAVAQEEAEAPADQASTAASTELKTFEQRASYFFGQVFGRNLKETYIEVDIEVLARGLQDALEGKESLFSDQEMEAMNQEIVGKVQELRQKKTAEEGVANKKAQEEFLVANKEKEGVMATESGLQYKELKAGDGPKPALTDTVKVHYSGRLLDGTVFDSSYERGEPMQFGLNGVIEGWGEGLQLMPVGSKYELYIPYQLAYKEVGIPGSIPPCSLLTFEVELLEIVAPEAAEDAAVAEDVAPAE
ncbi:FKBP-type peptidyl-prolyl cis-trans isomerase [Candidatus Sumerlaeota bacterium]|nr:FKBP-type peptidyl-prolyl cis-trans isomerase [Candidatus Sumerlaeota bacterium]